MAKGGHKIPAGIPGMFTVPEISRRYRIPEGRVEYVLACAMGYNIGVPVDEQDWSGKYMIGLSEHEFFLDRAREYRREMAEDAVVRKERIARLSAHYRIPPKALEVLTYEYPRRKPVLPGDVFNRELTPGEKAILGAFSRMWGNRELLRLQITYCVRREDRDTLLYPPGMTDAEKRVYGYCLNFYRKQKEKDITIRRKLQMMSVVGYYLQVVTSGHYVNPKNKALHEFYLDFGGRSLLVNPHAPRSKRPTLRGTLPPEGSGYDQGDWEETVRENEYRLWELVSKFRKIARKARIAAKDE